MRNSTRDVRPLLAYHTPIEALSKDIQHRLVLGEDLGHEVRDPTLLGDHRQALDQDRAETAIMEVVGDLDRDFRPRLVELDVGGMADEQAELVMCDQSTMVRAAEAARCAALLMFAAPLKNRKRRASRHSP